MSEAIVARRCVTGYDVIRLTVQDFRKSIRQYKKNPDSIYNLRNMLDHMQFMQTDDSFDMLPQDVNDLIDDELSEESENPVQNKVITAELNKKLDKVEFYDSAIDDEDYP